jgi:hypothetical protein
MCINYVDSWVEAEERTFTPPPAPTPPRMEERVEIVPSSG